MPGLTPKQVESFWSEGFVAPLPAFSPAEARDLRTWVETFERDHPHDRWAFNLKANLLFESIDRLVRDARFLDPIEELIGPNLLISTATFRIKEASTLVRGRDDHGHFAPEPAPIGEFTESNIQARREVLHAYPDNVYFGVAPGRGRPSFPDRPAA